MRVRTLCLALTVVAVSASLAAAQQTPAAKPAPAAVETSEYSKRVVAYIHGTTPITREELGEYLIARYGVEKLELLVNKLIIEHACKELQIEVTAAEVDAAVAEDARSIQIDTKTFVDQVLKNYRKTLYEWKEDVIRPRLLLTKLCANRIRVEDDDLRKGFEAKYGEKVEGRIVLWPKGEDKHARQQYAKLRDSEDEFANAATHQSNPHLAAAGGKIKPIGRHGAENPELEREVFRLQPGECSALIETPDGLLMFRCDNRITPEKGKTFEAEREALAKEIFDRKVQKEIPKIFAELKKQADPVLILTNHEKPEELRQSTEKLLEATKDVAPNSIRPKGN